jgi:hypothetical protein
MLMIMVSVIIIAAGVFVIMVGMIDGICDVG